MPDFEVKITTPAQLEGAKALAEALAVARDKAEALGQSTEHLDAELAKVKTSIALAGKAEEEGAKGVEKLGLSHHQLHGVLDEVAPGLAQMARFLTSGFAGAIGGVLVAFQFLNEKLEQFKKYLEDIDTGPGARGEWAQKIRDNTREAAVEVALFNDRLEAAARAQETLDKVTDRVIAHQREQAAASKELGDAQHQLEIARLELAERLGQITPDQAVRIRLEIDDAAFKRQLAAEKAAVQAELAARQQEFSANENREPTLGGAVDRASAATLAAKNAQDKNAGKLEQDKKDLADLQAQQQKLQSGVNLDDIIPKWVQKFAQEGSPIDLAKSGSDQIAQMIAMKMHAVGQEEGKQTSLETAASLAKQQAERAKTDYEAAAKISDETQQTIADLQAKLAGVIAKNTALQSIHDQTSAAHPNNAQVADWQAQARFSALSGGELDRVASDARAAMANARSAVASGHGNAEVLHDLMNEFLGLAHDLHASTVARGQFNDLAREVESLRTRVDHNQNPG